MPRLEATMFAVARTVIYASLFIGLVLIFVPAQILEMSGIARPATTGAFAIVGGVVGVLGAALALWCVAAFALLGKGTPAPFDPPRRLVTRGPYGYVRNPMYIGAALALGGAALVYRSPGLLAYLCLFAVATHTFVVLYEEPALRRQFDAEYAAYCARVRRWLPRL
jgi:protein-S-isoprenylcysteine O-methyltransferase Ste14